MMCRELLLRVHSILLHCRCGTLHVHAMPAQLFYPQSNRVLQSVVVHPEGENHGRDVLILPGYVSQRDHSDSNYTMKVILKCFRTLDYLEGLGDLGNLW